MLGQEIVEKPKTKKWLKFLFKKALPLTLAGAVLFTLGWFGGSGRISIGGYGSENKKLPGSLDYSSVDIIYRTIKAKFDGSLDESKLLDGLKTGLASATGDPYTEYFNAKDAKDFYGELDGTFEGIGAELGKDASNNIIVISPLAGYPAEKAGLMPKDVIGAIDGKVTNGMTINDAVKLIRGAAGTSVKLTIIRDNAQLDISVTREAITVPSLKSEIKDGIGILTISRFGDDTTSLAQKAAQDFKNQNVKGVVLDLRGDPGGLLQAAVNVSSLWLKNKTVLTERRDGQIIQTYKSEGTPVLLGMPTVVLINGGSASASEITSGALHDNSAATLMGVQSFGKGSVQEPVNLVDGSLLKVTIARWYTPAGNNIDKQGITPDKKVEMTEDDYKNGKDPQLDAALKFLN